MKGVFKMTAAEKRIMRDVISRAQYNWMVALSCESDDDDIRKIASELEGTYCDKLNGYKLLCKELQLPEIYELGCGLGRGNFDNADNKGLYIKD